VHHDDGGAGGFFVVCWRGGEVETYHDVESCWAPAAPEASYCCGCLCWWRVHVRGYRMLVLREGVKEAKASHDGTRHHTHTEAPSILQRQPYTLYHTPNPHYTAFPTTHSPSLCMCLAYGHISPSDSAFFSLLILPLASTSSPPTTG
jgi:hypothetical protein